jgi:hypothetical protein
MVARKTVCLRRLGVDRRGELRVNRFFASEKVTTEKIVASWSGRTAAACAGRHVLAVQDTSEIKFSTSALRRRGLGPVKKGNTHGLLVHAMIAVDAQSGACLGLVGGEVWTRDGVVATDHAARPPDERESLRWQTTAIAAKAVLSQAAMVTVVDDREGDIYAKWATVPDARTHLLTRAMKDRRLAGEAMLFAGMDRLPAAGRRVIALPGRALGEPARNATLEVGFGTFEIARPNKKWSRHLPATVRLRAVDVRETGAPAGVEPLHWRLLTTHDVADAAQAWDIVDMYRKRWSIEQLFRLTKSQGLQLEDSQVATAERLTKLAAAAIKAACIDLQLTQERDGRAGLAAALVFDDAEVETLEAVGATLEGSTERQRNPHPPKSLARASWFIARLGSWHCYGKPPGPIIMRRGMQELKAIHRGRMLMVVTS